MPAPKDLLEFEDPVSIDLSSDGKHILLQTKRAIVDSNDYDRTSWLIPTAKKQPTQKLDLPSGARKLTWFPDGERIAYLAPSKQGKQVYTKKVGSESAQQITHQKRGVRNFSISPNGDRIAYTSLIPPEKPKHPETNSNDSWEGVEIDLDAFGVEFLFKRQLPSSRGPSPRMQFFILDLRDKTKKTITDSYWVEDYRWSPTGDKIALTGTPASTFSAVLFPYRTDLMIYKLGTSNLKTIKKGKESKYIKGAVSYSSPFWSPSGNKLGFKRTEPSGTWVRVGELGIVNLKNNQTQYLTSSNKQALHGAYFQWVKEDQIFVEYTKRTKSGLFSISIQDGKITPLHHPDNRAFAFSFDENRQYAVWIEESISHPPEIFYASGSFEHPQKVSNLNENYKNIWLPDAREISWTSSDGTTVYGWLVEPKNSEPNKSAPLLTVVHGGPGTPAKNSFHPYGGWQYPIQLWAARGNAVFIPNYRGTSSFGETYKDPTAIDKEPVHDIVTGIEYLISKGVASKDSLGIMGHSHGSWLGPMVVAEYPNFQAASFAEGYGNFLSLYGQMPGMLNRVTHEKEMTNNKTPYNNPDRYLELSPVFQEQFTKTTPTLFEYGQKAGAIQGLEIAKALWRHDTPQKLIIYPDTGHNLFEPSKKVESMERNLQWFDKWIKNN